MLVPQDLAPKIVYNTIIIIISQFLRIEMKDITKTLSICSLRLTISSSDLEYSKQNQQTEEPLVDHNNEHIRTIHRTIVAQTETLAGNKP